MEEDGVQISVVLKMTSWILAYLTVGVVTVTSGSKDSRLSSYAELFSCPRNSQLCRSLFHDRRTMPEEEPDVVFPCDNQITDFGNDDYFDENPLEKIETPAKRVHSSTPGCDCQAKNELIDLGHSHFPRYLFSAVCENDDEFTRNNNQMHHSNRKCWLGTQCKPIEYKVRVLTYRTQSDAIEKDHLAPLLPDELRSDWKFRTISVAAGCFCSF